MSNSELHSLVQARREMRTDTAEYMGYNEANKMDLAGNDNHNLTISQSLAHFRIPRFLPHERGLFRLLIALLGTHSHLAR